MICLLSVGCMCVQAKQAITKNCESLIKHAKARRLKFIPVEVLPADEVHKRLPKRSQQLALAKGSLKRSAAEAAADVDHESIAEDVSNKRTKTDNDELDQKNVAEESEAVDSNEEAEVDESENEMSEDDGNLRF